MIPTSWRKMSEMTWKGPDDGCARVLSSTQSDGKTVRGYSAEVTGPLRATQQEAIRDAERAIWAFGKAPEQCTADPVDSLAFAIYQHTSEDTLDDAGRARYRRAAEVALQIARGTTPDREALARALYTECETDRSQKWSARHPGASAAAPVWDRCIPEIREDWLSIADTAIRMVPTMTSDDLDRVKAQTDRLEALLVRVRASVDYEDGIEQTDDDLIEHLDGIMARLEMAERMVLDVSPRDATDLRSQLNEAACKIAEVEKDRDGWRQTAKKIDEGLTFNVNLRDRMLAAAGYASADLEAGVQWIAHLKSEVRIAGDRLAVVGRKVAQVEKDRAEDQREIRIAHEFLDTANVPRMAGGLPDRICRLYERCESQSRDKLLAQRQRDRAEAERDRLRDEVERLREQAKLTEQQQAASDRDDPISVLIADYEARIGVLEAIDKRRTHALGILSLELAEALGVKKVTS